MSQMATFNVVAWKEKVKSILYGIIDLFFDRLKAPEFTIGAFQSVEAWILQFFVILELEHFNPVEHGFYSYVVILEVDLT